MANGHACAHSPVHVERKRCARLRRASVSNGCTYTVLTASEAYQSTTEDTGVYGVGVDNMPHRKHDSAWKQFETFGVTVRRERPIRDSEGHVSKRYELPATAAERALGRGPRFTLAPQHKGSRGIKRDSPIGELQLPSVHTGERLLSQEETYTPAVCTCGQQAEKNSTFCAACNSATRRYLAKFS
jgi:hypothetical protein